MKGRAEESESIKVIGAGWGRTGTNSLMIALEMIGYNPCYHMEKNIQHNHCEFWKRVLRGDPYDFDEILSSFRATTDFPSAMYWKEQLAKYPNAKVVLTMRDEEAWFRSCEKTIFLMIPGNPYAPWGIKIANMLGLGPVSGFSEMSKILGEKALNGLPGVREVCLPLYRAHINDVLNNCPKEKLLVMNISEGWKPLCEFLGKPIPDAPFPRVNDTASFQKHVQFVNCLGYSMLGIILLATGLSGYGIYTFGGMVLKAFIKDGEL